MCAFAVPRRVFLARNLALRSLIWRERWNQRLPRLRWWLAVVVADYRQKETFDWRNFNYWPFSSGFALTAGLADRRSDRGFYVKYCYS